MAAKTNGYYDDLVESYLFAEVARRASKYEAEHPDVKMIRMGIGDVTRPLPPVVTEAIKDASDEMGRADTLDRLGIYYTGGKNSPYIWLRCPDITKCADYDEVIAGTPSAADPDAPLSWKFFDYLLQKAAVVGTPGAGFGTSGEAFLRLTAFSTKENTQEAMERLTKMLGTE